MSIRRLGAVTIQLLLVIPAVLRAQSSGQFEPLSKPPEGVGSCMPAASAGVDTVKMQGHRLVLKSPQPGRQRTMSAFVSDRGVTSYFEMSMGATGTTSSTSSNYFASFNADGMLFGHKSNIQVVLPDSVLSDPQGFLNGKYQQSITSSREPLSDSEQQRIRDLIAFLRKRCPA